MEQTPVEYIVSVIAKQYPRIEAAFYYEIEVAKLKEKIKEETVIANAYKPQIDLLKSLIEKCELINP